MIAHISIFHSLGILGCTFMRWRSVFIAISRACKVYITITMGLVYITIIKVSITMGCRRYYLANCTLHCSRSRHRRYLQIHQWIHPRLIMDCSLTSSRRERFGSHLFSSGFAHLTSLNWGLQRTRRRRTRFEEFFFFFTPCILTKQWQWEALLLCPARKRDQAVAECKWKCQKAKVDPDDDGGRFSTSFSGTEQQQHQDMHCCSNCTLEFLELGYLSTWTWSVALVHVNVFGLNHQTAETSAICTFKAGDVWMANSNWRTRCLNFWCWKWFHFCFTQIHIWNVNRVQNIKLVFETWGNKDFQKCVLLRLEQVRNCVKSNEPRQNTNAVSKLCPYHLVTLVTIVYM